MTDFKSDETTPMRRQDSRASDKMNVYTGKHGSRHVKSCKRLTAKFAHIRDCVTLVGFNEEYKKDIKKLERQAQNRRKYLMRCKYERLIPEMIGSLQRKPSLINAKIVKDYSLHIDELERNSMTPAELPKGQWRYKRNKTKQHKKEKEDDRKTNTTQTA